MKDFFIIEIPLDEMRKVFSMQETAGFYFCKTQDDKDIQQFINDEFCTSNREYEYFIHKVDLQQIQENHFVLFPVFYGHNNFELDGDVQIIDE